jgi:hypothetical protein
MKHYGFQNDPTRKFSFFVIILDSALCRIASLGLILSVLFVGYRLSLSFNIIGLQTSAEIKIFLFDVCVPTGELLHLHLLYKSRKTLNNLSLALKLWNTDRKCFWQRYIYIDKLKQFMLIHIVMLQNQLCIALATAPTGLPRIRTFPVIRYLFSCPTFSQLCHISNMQCSDLWLK